MADAQAFLGPWVLEADDGTVTSVEVPGTVTQAHPDAHDADLRTWLFRTTVRALPAGPADLVLEGIATSYQVLLDGQVLLTGTSMYAEHRVDVTDRLAVGSVLEIRCLPLATALPEGKAPRARWRSRLVDDGALRLIRTTLLGRCPGIAPGPPVVGPWRPVRVEARRPAVRLSTRLEGTTGILTVDCDAEVTVACAGVSGGPGELRLPDVARWWPHTHGDPVLHDVQISHEGQTWSAGQVGFRSSWPTPTPAPWPWW